MEEKEVKFLNINPEDMEKRLLQIGAQRIGEVLFQSTSFDHADLRLDKQASWVRLRTDGNETKLAFKQRLGTTTNDGTASDKGMEEIEISVDDYHKTIQLLLKAGLVEKFSQEKKRISWIKDSVKFDIDFWPRLNPLLEIEADSWEAVENAITELKLNPEDKKIFSATQAYKLNGINDKDYIRMTFTEFVKRQ